MEFTLLGAAAIAVGASYATLRYEGGRTNSADCTRDVWDALVGAAMVGLLIGRLVAMARSGTNPLTNIGDILILRAGIDTVAATLSGLAAFWVLSRADPWRMADAAAPAAVAGLSGWQAACVVRDACLGTPSGLPWAVAQNGSQITRHPVEIYAALLLIAGSVFLILWKRSRPNTGVVAAVAVAVGSLARLITEPLRPGLGADLTPWYAAAALGGIAVALWRARWRPASTGADQPG